MLYFHIHKIQLLKTRSKRLFYFHEVVMTAALRYWFWYIFVMWCARRRCYCVCTRRPISSSLNRDKHTPDVISPDLVYHRAFVCGMHTMYWCLMKIEIKADNWIHILTFHIIYYGLCLCIGYGTEFMSLYNKINRNLVLTLT